MADHAREKELPQPPDAKDASAPLDIEALCAELTRDAGIINRVACEFRGDYLALQEMKHRFGIIVSALKSASLPSPQRWQHERDVLRAALVNLVGVDGRHELEEMEVTLRALPGPAADKAAAIDGIHALLATLPDPLPPQE